MTREPISDRALLDLQRQSFQYFVHEANPDNGLVADRSESDSPASIAATALALTAYPVAVERGFMKRQEAVRRTLAALRFFRHGRQGIGEDAIGYQGFYYHFLDQRSGKRVGQSELSTIDTAFLLAGMLTVAAYFDGGDGQEKEIRETASELCRRANWSWAQDGGLLICHGWKPKSGFLPYRWGGYCEAMILYILALGSASFAVTPQAYQEWTSTYPWRKCYDHEFLYSGPLFTHQLSHVWIDFRGIQDAYMRGKCIDYFENSRRATYIQRQYAIENPRHFTGYGEYCWGVSASDGPGPVTRHIGGKRRRFYDYVARGVPYGPDDGTIAPWAAVAALPFAPEIVLPVLNHFEHLKLRTHNRYGFKATFNMTFPQRRSFWISPYHLALNQGPLVCMVENFRTGLIWRLLRSSAPIVRGLRRAGFAGGWLAGEL